MEMNILINKMIIQRFPLLSQGQYQYAKLVGLDTLFFGAKIKVSFESDVLKIEHWKMNETDVKMIRNIFSYWKSFWSAKGGAYFLAKFEGRLKGA